MKNITPGKIKKLAEAGKRGEAKKEVNAYLKSMRVYGRDAAALYLGLAELYVDAANRILSEFRERQDQVLKELKELKMKEDVLVQ